MTQMSTKPVSKTQKVRTPMKAVINTLAILATSFVVMAGPAHAGMCRDADNTDPAYKDLPVCAATPTGEVPEPSSPLLFLAAAGMAGIVMRMRKK
jgi:hypothetical protein